LNFARAGPGWSLRALKSAAGRLGRPLQALQRSPSTGAFSFRRIFGADFLQGPRGEVRSPLLATVTDRGAVAGILARLGWPTAPPPRVAAGAGRHGPS
jgi:hypothetical protein